VTEKQAHFVMTSKGGVGKSFVASILTQWLMAAGHPVVPYDNDPATASLKAYSGLPVRQLELVKNRRVDKTAYDCMVEEMVSTEAVFVIDNGASNFLELTSYIFENELFCLLSDHGIKPIVHAPVMGGGSLLLSAGALGKLAEVLPTEADLVVWLNEREGSIEADGKTWHQMAVYRNWSHRISAEVTIPYLEPDTFLVAVRKMLERSLTFEEVRTSADFNLMERQRVHQVRRGLFEQLDAVLQ
jgi:hypothetical protein